MAPKNKWTKLAIKKLGKKIRNDPDALYLDVRNAETNEVVALLTPTKKGNMLRIVWDTYDFEQDGFTATKTVQSHGELVGIPFIVDRVPEVEAFWPDLNLDSRMGVSDVYGPDQNTKWHFCGVVETKEATSTTQAVTVLRFACEPVTMANMYGNPQESYLDDKVQHALHAHRTRLQQRARKLAASERKNSEAP